MDDQFSAHAALRPFASIWGEDKPKRELFYLLPMNEATLAHVLDTFGSSLPSRAYEVLMRWNGMSNALRDRCGFTLPDPCPSLADWYLPDSTHVLRSAVDEVHQPDPSRVLLMQGPQCVLTLQATSEIFVLTRGSHWFVDGVSFFSAIHPLTVLREFGFATADTRFADKAFCVRGDMYNGLIAVCAATPIKMGEK